MRAPKLLKSARGQACVRCGTENGTVCARHYNGRRQHAYGKGIGTKCHDLASAELCSECDRLFAEGSLECWTQSEQGKTARSEEFLHCVMKTNIARFDRGDLQEKK